MCGDFDVALDSLCPDFRRPLFHDGKGSDDPCDVSLVQDLQTRRERSLQSSSKTCFQLTRILLSFAYSRNHLHRLSQTHVLKS